MTINQSEKTNAEIERWLNNYCQEVFPTPQVNFGGAVKRVVALRECLKICFYLQAGTIDDLIIHFKKRLGLTTRKLREDYIEDLFINDVIKQNSSNWKYIGSRPK